MNIQEIIKYIGIESRANSRVLNIKSLMLLLNAVDNNYLVKCYNADMSEKYLEKSWHSDRGDYYNLAISISDKVEYLSVLDIKNILTDALNTGVMKGYKGGEFPITNNTLLYVRNYGEVGFGIVDVELIDNIVIFHVVNDYDL